MCVYLYTYIIYLIYLLAITSNDRFHSYLDILLYLFASTCCREFSRRLKAGKSHSPPETVCSYLIQSHLI